MSGNEDDTFRILTRVPFIELDAGIFTHISSPIEYLTTYLLVSGWTLPEYHSAYETNKKTSNNILIYLRLRTK